MAREVEVWRLVQARELLQKPRSGREGWIPSESEELHSRVATEWPPEIDRPPADALPAAGRRCRGCCKRRKPFLRRVKHAERPLGHYILAPTRRCRRRRRAG